MSHGVPLKTISERMGHGSIEVTANSYLHSLEGQVLDTANARGARAGCSWSCGGWAGLPELRAALFDGHLMAA